MSILSYSVELCPFCPFFSIYVHFIVSYLFRSTLSLKSFYVYFVKFWAIFSTDLEVGISHWYTNGIRGISVQNLNQFTKASKFTQNHSGHVWLTLSTTGLWKLWMMQSHATRMQRAFSLVDHQLWAFYDFEGKEFHHFISRKGFQAFRAFQAF